MEMIRASCCAFPAGRTAAGYKYAKSLPESVIQLPRKLTSLMQQWMMSTCSMAIWQHRQHGNFGYHEL